MLPTNESRRNVPTEMWPIDRPKMYDKNPRKIPPEAVNKVAISLAEYGWRQPIVVDDNGVILAGHVRLLAARKLGEKEVPVHIAKGLTKAQAAAFRLMDNRSHEEATWDYTLLSLEIDELRNLDYDLNLTGFDEDEIRKMAKQNEQFEQSLLPMMNITIAEPLTKVTASDIWMMQDKHVLIVESVISGWRVWSKYLREGCLFCPFPGPFVLLSENAMTYSLVLVQPDLYIAGHIIDRFIEVNGKESVRRETHSGAVAA